MFGWFIFRWVYIQVGLYQVVLYSGGFIFGWFYIGCFYVPVGLYLLQFIFYGLIFRGGVILSIICTLVISCGWFIFRGLVTLYIEMCRSVFFIQPALLLFFKHPPHSSSAISPFIEVIIPIFVVYISRLGVFVCNLSQFNSRGFASTSAKKLDFRKNEYWYRNSIDPCIRHCFIYNNIMLSLYFPTGTGTKRLSRGF